MLPAKQQTAALTGAHTLHHPLSHTSGLPNYHDDEAVTWDSLLSCWDRVPCQRARRTADLLPLFRGLPAAAPPGERFSCADANYSLAGLVIEAVTGKPYAEAAAEEVLTPAGMEDSGSTSATQTRRGWHRLPARAGRAVRILAGQCV